MENKNDSQVVLAPNLTEAELRRLTEQYQQQLADFKKRNEAAAREISLLVEDSNRRDAEIADLSRRFREQQSEYTNLSAQVLAWKAKPDFAPRLEGVKIFGGSIPVYAIGGDHITYMDFDRRYDLETRIAQAKDPQVKEQLQLNKQKVGIMLIDVEGHQDSDAVLATTIHNLLLLGTQYELEKYGQITTNLFEQINTRAFQSTGFTKSATMIYGEIWSNGTFRFISAGHPYPLVFSNANGTLATIRDRSGRELVSSAPIGQKLSATHTDIKKYSSLLGYKEPYEVNEIMLEGSGDIAILHSDGLFDAQNRQGKKYSPENLERVLRGVKHLPAKDIFYAVKDDVLSFCRTGKQNDDITYVIIKRD